MDGWFDGQDAIDIFRDMLPGQGECGFGLLLGRPLDGRSDLSFDVCEFGADTGTGSGYAAAKGL